MAEVETAAKELVPLVSLGGDGGGVGLLENPRRYSEDMRLLRRLIRSPVYVPNEYFRKAAVRLWDIANTSDDARVCVGAIKTINEICKINLLVRERQSDKPNINLHLHKHERDGAAGGAQKLSESELLQLKALMEKAGLTGD